MFEDIKTTPEYGDAYTELHDRHFAEQIGINTDQIIAALSEDPNEAPSKILSYGKGQGFLIKIDKDPATQNALNANFIDNQNLPHGGIVLTKSTGEEDSTHEFKIQSGTFDKLNNLIVDPDVAEANVKSQLDHTL